MTDRAAEISISSPGLSVEVVVAGVVFAASAGATGLTSFAPQHPPSTLLLLGWPVWAVVGGILLDQHSRSPLGRTLSALAVAPVVVLAWSIARFHEAGSPAVARGTAELAAVLAVSVALAVPWAYQNPTPVGAARAGAAVAAGGSFVVVVGEVIAQPSWLTPAGWALGGAGSAVTWALVARAAGFGDRVVRRRIGWLLVSLSVCGGAVAAAWWLGPGPAGYYATCAALVLGALVVAGLHAGTGFRPLDEHLLDLGLVLGVLVAAALTAALVRLGSEVAARPSGPGTVVFTSLLTATAVTPVAFWVRRAALARRYGSGLISPADVAAITADLHARAEPRDLLGKAARMVAAASGCSDARIVLDDDDPSAGDHWVVHPLLVGTDRVGSLLIESADAEGPEVRQQRAVAQLLPTVSLVARAVGLAVEAEHARRDVARERDVERRRVLSDLHDGLGPVLAGMSMRVQAALRTSEASGSSALLRDLAAELTASRADLRRIVAGITPSTLDDGDLAGALQGMVESFRRTGGPPRVDLEVVLEEQVAAEVQVAVYRSVAEGITNALRHAAASSISVRVRSAGGRALVEIVDDGIGGPIVAGVGLSSLARRAESLGGGIALCPVEPHGTALRLDLPTGRTS